LFVKVAELLALGLFVVYLTELSHLAVGTTAATFFWKALLLVGGVVGLPDRGGFCVVLEIYFQFERFGGYTHKIPLRLSKETDSKRM